jgi:hypothetical protein
MPFILVVTREDRSRMKRYGPDEMGCAIFSFINRDAEVAAHADLSAPVTAMYPFFAPVTKAVRALTGALGHSEPARELHEQQQVQDAIDAVRAHNPYAVDIAVTDLEALSGGDHDIMEGRYLQQLLERTHAATLTTLTNRNNLGHLRVALAKYLDTVDARIVKSNDALAYMRELSFLAGMRFEDALGIPSGFNPVPDEGRVHVSFLGDVHVGEHQRLLADAAGLDEDSDGGESSGYSESDVAMSEGEDVCDGNDSEDIEDPESDDDEDAQPVEAAAAANGVREATPYLLTIDE